MTLRDQRQAEFARRFIERDCWGILNLCPRFGKIYTSINIFELLKPKRIMIAYPDNKIRDSWKADFKTRGFDDSNVTYTTHLSIKKHMDEPFDLVVLDEIHLLSPAQIDVVYALISRPGQKVLGLTGTLSKWTRKKLYDELNLPVVAIYPLEKAIEEGVIKDYQIKVLRVPLDTVTRRKFDRGIMTEKQQFDSQTRMINYMEEQGKNSKFMRFARMRTIQGSLAKVQKTRQVLERFKNERILVFCGTTDVADNLGIPSYHSKSNEKELFEQFAQGVGNHMAVVKIGNTGVSYKPLNIVIINYFDSNAENLTQKINRSMNYEYNNPDNKAHIYIITSTEPVELKWLDKALEFFDKSKITII